MPLYSCFIRIREELSNGLLSIEDYTLLIKALNRGFGLKDREALLSLCKAIWLKPGMDSFQFEDLFHKGLEEELLSLQEAGEEEPFSEKEVVSEKTKTQSSAALESQVDNALEEEQEILKKEEAKPEEKLYLGIDKRKGASSGLEKGAKKTDFAYHFDFSKSFLPVTERQIQHNLRLIQQYKETINTDLIDISATVASLTKKAFLDEFIYQKEWESDSKIHLFVDHAGSMEVFEAFYEHLINSIQKTQYQLSVYYYSNVPDEYVFYNRAETREGSIYDLEKMQTALIFSDAGGSGHSLNKRRLAKTEDFLDALKKVSGQVLWMNPVERKRWKNTTAEEIEKLIPMYEFSDAEFKKAIQFLKKNRGRKQG